MNFNVTGLDSKITIPVINVTGSTISKGTLLAVNGTQWVVDSTNPSGYTPLLSVIDANGRSVSEFLGVADDDIDTASKVQENASGPDVYGRGGVGKCVVYGHTKIELGGTVTVTDALFLSASNGAVDTDGAVASAGEVSVGWALAAGDDGDVVDCFLSSPRVDKEISPLTLEYGGNATLGSEKVTNGGFDSDLSGWTIGGTGSGWSQSSGTALHSTGNTDTLSQDTTEASGEVYVIELTISGRTAGSIDVACGGVTYGSSLSSNATHTISVVATGTGDLTITPTSNFDGAIDDVSVKKVTASTPVLTLKDASGTVQNEFRGSDTSNVFVGENAGENNVTGDYNTVLGDGAFSSNTTGSFSVACGDRALYSNTTGSYSVACGYRAMNNNTTGSGSVACGYQALYGNTTGSYSVACGYRALYNNTEGSYSVACGDRALYNNTTGSYSVACGYQALYNNTTGNLSVAHGYRALYNNTDGDHSVACGSQALYNSDVSGTAGNIALGYKAGGNLTTGTYNIVIGYDVDAPEVDSTQTLNIGNLLFGTGLDGTDGTLSAGGIGIGVKAVDASAKLEVTSTTKGFLPPRMTTTQRDNVSSPATGLVVYNTSTNKLNFYNGSAWEAVTSS